MNELVEVLPPGAGRDVWLKARRQGIGASEIAAVLAISPWESPFSLYWRKVEGWEVEASAEMSAGTRAEPVIADWFAEQHDEFYVAQAGLYAHPDRPWQLATPDRLLYEPCDCDEHNPGDELVLTGLVECKYEPHGWDGWGEPGTDQIPVYYRAQGLQQLDVLGVDQMYFAAWHGAEFREYLIRRDEKDLRVMRHAGQLFMDRIEAGDPPPIGGHTATIGALKRIHPSIDQSIDDIPVPVQFAEGYRRARAARARAEQLVDRYEARARAMLGNGRRLVCGKQLVVSRSVYDQSGDMVELDSLDADPPTVDRLNPGRAKSYV